MILDVNKASNIEELKSAILNSDLNYRYKKRGRSASSYEYELGTKAYNLKVNEFIVFDRPKNFNENQLRGRFMRLNNQYLTKFKFAIIKIDEVQSKVIRLL